MKPAEKKQAVLARFGASDVAHFDAHVHTPWLTEPLPEGIAAFGQTVTPQEYVENLQSPLGVADLSAKTQGLCRFSEDWSEHDPWDPARFRAGSQGSCSLGLGLHPWYVSQASVEEFERLAKATDLIGEIGLDFLHDSYKWANDNGIDVQESPKEEQIRIFTRVCRAIQQGSYVSVHAVGTKGIAHKILKETGVLDHSIVIYHWFSDDGDTLHQAIKDGCLFSVNSWMLETKRGREYSKQIPIDQKLWETDQPEHKGEPYNFDFPESL